MNAINEKNMRIKISTLHKYAPVVKALAASFYPIKDLSYPWEPWMAYPCGSFERGAKVIFSAPSLKMPDDEETIEGLLYSEDSSIIVAATIEKCVQEYYGQRVCSVEVDWV